MEYLNQEEEGLSREGLIGTILVHLLLLLCFWFFYIQAVPPQVKGMIINLGTVEKGLGENTPQQNEEAASPPPVPEKVVEKPIEKTTPPKAQTPKPAVENKVQEVKDETAPTLPTETPKKKEDKKDKKEEKVKDKKKEEKKPEPPKEEPKEEKVKEEKKPELDERALFRKRDKKNDKTNESTSQGNSDPDEDQGVDTDTDVEEQSQVYTPSRDIGMHDKGTFKYDLQGRNMVSFPDVVETSQKEGIVAVKIKVDNKGKVIGAEYTGKGSTTSDSKLKQAAIKAAKEAKFNFAPNAPAVQVGTITFTFKVQ